MIPAWWMGFIAGFSGGVFVATVFWYERFREYMRKQP